MPQVNSFLKNKRKGHPACCCTIKIPIWYEFELEFESFVPFLSRYLTSSGRKSLTKVDELVISCNFMVNHSPFRQFLEEIDSFRPVFSSKKQPHLRSYLANMDLGGFWPINPHSFREHTLF